MNVIVDSCFFVSLFFKDVNHKKAMEIFRVFKKEKMKMIISAIILPEICSAIIRQTNDKVRCSKVRTKLLNWIEIGFLQALYLNKERMILSSDVAIEFGLKGPDAIHVELAKELKLPFLTFDEEIKSKIKDKIELYKF